MGKVSASELIRTLQRGSKRSLLARALGELGRIPKTLHLLTFIDDPCYRRDILTQLNRGEGRHRLSRKCFHGQRGELRQRYREGQMPPSATADANWSDEYLAQHSRSRLAELRPKPKSSSQKSTL
jgi:TnpA family transposase